MFVSLKSDTKSASGKKDKSATVGAPDPDLTEGHSIQPADMIPGLMQKKSFAKEEIILCPWT